MPKTDSESARALNTFLAYALCFFFGMLMGQAFRAIMGWH
jgi:hypothetical protein